MAGRSIQGAVGRLKAAENAIAAQISCNRVYIAPPEHLAATLDALERLIHDGSQEFSPLTRAALVHLHFETIHPFVAGYGRVGHLLILSCCKKAASWMLPCYT